MRYQRTQIYLDPEEHRRLVREAADRGISLAAYLRQIVASRAGEQAMPYQAPSWERFIGALDDERPVVHYEDPDEEVHEAFLAAHERELRRNRRSEPE